MIADAMKITNIEYSDFHAMFFTSIISQIPRMAKVVKNKVRIANNIDIPFLNIIFNFSLIKYRNNVANYLIVNVKDC